MVDILARNTASAGDGPACFSDEYAIHDDRVAFCQVGRVKFVFCRDFLGEDDGVALPVQGGADGQVIQGSDDIVFWMDFCNLHVFCIFRCNKSKEFLKKNYKILF